ncbi:hypothetical protein [Paractinoplanes durhamensis]|uniref:hypothetical protein n=1 Tax=Paractinoplanes durhamensis TaxID=113563 RepID=UPI00364426C5
MALVIVVAEAARPVDQRSDEIDFPLVGHQFLPEPDAISARHGETVGDGIAERHYADAAIGFGTCRNRRGGNSRENRDKHSDGQVQKSAYRWRGIVFSASARHRNTPFRLP